MIVLIEGKLLKATPLSAIVSAGGLGYSVNIPVTTAEKLPQIGENVSLHTHAVYREDSQALYGFWHESDRDFFALVIEKVSGVGPKVAISLMSKLSLESLIDTIRREDSVLLAKTPGIGKKTAERIIIELKDKMIAFQFAAKIENGTGSEAISSPTQHTSTSEDAVLALQALGYKPADAQKAIDKVVHKLGPNLSTEAMIKATFG
ncbi:MAG: Holliday junction branch migration protein RuvA [Opitutales bacterium]|jgi:holliday junction DNA helicase RuvA|nr:Holliday junction branch migration protein RuvA [Opitutales bacterium]MBT5814831.1 Holliday junction branch migration protein RuvA [Opitutales bacterium]MBT6381368.1 Holliday junction branch migration protein RuvA [Opitutales bacterium]MBT6770011.1 Holliday junction branch migration protein RuvA [Opitutales bacterium]MDG2255599.1 Holliday junction branch migration protein RuvA [Opitutaceae bacterium]